MQNNLLHTQWNNGPGAAEGGGSCGCTYLLHYALVRQRSATRYYVLSKYVYFVYLLSVNGRGVSTSELHVQVRIEDKVHCIYSQFSHYTHLLQQYMYMLSLHIYAV